MALRWTVCRALSAAWALAVAASTGFVANGFPPTAESLPGRIPAAQMATLSGYDRSVLQDRPAGYWTSSLDVTGRGHQGRFTGKPGIAVMPNGDRAPRYDGVKQYLTIPDARDWSVTRTGALTVEAWLRPDTLQFPNGEGPGKGYVHWLGKGSPQNQEYVARMYSLHNPENRPNRISGYAFNLAGGEGAGSYFQDVVRVGQWIHYALVIHTRRVDTENPTGYVKVYKNGRLKDQDALVDYAVVPGDGTAPLRVGTRDLGSFFKGAIGKEAVYNHEVTADRLLRHYRSMTE
jgi:hypothetical protein